MIMINTFMTSGFGLTQELPHSFRPAFREARAGTSAGVPRETHQLRTVFGGKTMGKPWETHYFWGKLWENYGKTLDNSMIIACFLFFFWIPIGARVGSPFKESLDPLSKTLRIIASRSFNEVCTRSQLGFGQRPWEIFLLMSLDP